jgi:hypothetical protein
MAKRKRFELGKRIDGKLNRWETLSAYNLGMVRYRLDDYEVQVITNVYKNRREAFAK